MIFVMTLGDRWEMSAAVQSTIPFGIKLIHLHGGEKSLGSLDNIYRDQITIASYLHFPSSSIHADRVHELIGNKQNILSVGSLSIEELENFDLPSWDDVKKENFRIPFDDFILATFHPETIDNSKGKYINVILDVIQSLVYLGYCFVITKGNSDLGGDELNNKIFGLSKKNPENIIVIDSFGKFNYFSAMKQCQLILGNSSSALIESASFQKWAINVGDRQKGREHNENVIFCPYDKDLIIEGVKKFIKHEKYSSINKFYKKDGARNIIEKIKKEWRSI